MVYDAAVIGAGPAGSAVARLLALAGRRVLLVDKAEPGGAKVCGGFLGPEFDALASRLGLSPETFPHAPVRRLVLSGPDTAAFETRLPPARGVDRPSLDRWFFDAAVRAGASARTGVTATVRSAEEISISGKGGDERVRARRVIVASGRRPFKGRRAPFFGCKALFRGRLPNGEIALHFVPGANVGLNPVDAERTALCLYSDGAHLKRAKGDFDAMVRSFAEANRSLGAGLEGLSREGEWHACQAEPDGKTRLSEGGVFYAGDAAAMMHPLVGGGIGLGVASAVLLAEALLEEGRRDARGAVRRYEKKWRARFSGRVRLAAALGTCQRSRGATKALLFFLRGCPPALEALVRYSRPVAGA